jgi:diguanylate cyclase (GGDEF)-like protein/PAS domain S-box-containing protein
MTAPTIRVLVTEDAAEDAELEIRELRRSGMKVTHRVVDSADSFVAGLREFAPDIILSDFSMPGFDGMAALALARELTPETPFIFVSGTLGEEYAVRALRDGATDYVLKANLLRLPPAVERALAEARERRRRRRTEVELELTRERMTGVVTSIPDMLWSVDLRTEQLIYLSPAAKRIFGRDAEDFLANQRLWLDVVYTDDRPRMRAAWGRLRGGEPFEINCRIAHADGTLRWINNRGKLIRGSDGSPQRAEGLVRDITEQIEQRTRIERLSHIREFSSRINATLMRIRDREKLFREVCQIAVEVGGLNGAVAGTFDPGTQDVAWITQFRAGQSGNASELLLPASAREGDESGSGLVGQALRTLAPAIANDLARDSGIRRRDMALAHGIKAMAVFPLVVEGAPVGVLTLHAGEADFFDHDEVRLLTELAANVSFALELLGKQDRINYLGFYDPLTGLANQTLFQDRLAEHVRSANTTQVRFAVCVFDVDRFKVINDTLGRAMGDELLRQLAKRILEEVGDSRWVGRVGADRFVLLMPDIQSDTEAARRLEQLLSACFGAPFTLDGGELRVSSKAGLALFPTDAAHQDALFACAEAAWKRAKQTGDPYVFYTQRMMRAVTHSLRVENELRLALERKEFVLHYQPKVEVVTRRIIGVEALIRWQSPAVGLVPPAQFIPLMEETGLILQAGAWALSQAVLDHRQWVEQGLAAPRIAVNVSAIQLRQRDFVDVVSRAIGQGMGRPGIEIEITESRLMDDIDDSIEKLKAIRALGVSLAIDDFGTGHSSLAYLAKLPVNAIKIDRSFIITMGDDPNVMTLVSTMISMAHSLKLNVVAEGVDSEEQASILRRLGCEEMQGYLFNKPIPNDELVPLLRRNS